MADSQYDPSAEYLSASIQPQALRFESRGVGSRFSFLISQASIRLLAAIKRSCYLSQPAEQKSCSFGGCLQRAVPNEAQHLQHCTAAICERGPLEGKITYVRPRRGVWLGYTSSLISHLIVHIRPSLISSSDISDLPQTPFWKLGHYTW